MNRIALTLAAVLALGVSSCSTLKTIQTVSTYETSPQTAEAIIVSAEKTAEIAALTFDEFLRQERRYSAEIKAHLPRVHEFAEYLRFKVPSPAPSVNDAKVPRGQMYLMKLRSATEAFRLNRTSEGEANLRTAIASVKSLTEKTKANLEAIPAMKGP